MKQPRKQPKLTHVEDDEFKKGTPVFGLFPGVLGIFVFICFVILLGAN